MSVLDETLGCLKHLAAHPTEPTEALRAISTVRQRTGADIQLIWAREPDGDRVRYDALIHDPDATISLALEPGGPLRAPSKRVESTELLRVDGVGVSVRAAVELLDLVYDEDRVLTRLVDAALLARERDRRGLPEPSQDEILDALDDFCRDRGLFAAGALEDWLDEHGFDQARLESALGDRLLYDRLRDDVVAELDPVDVRAYDAALVSMVDFADVVLAWRALGAAAHGGLLNFARGALCDGSAVEVYVARRVLRTDLPEPHGSAVVDAEPGEVLGPIAIPGRHRVVEVLRTLPADPADPDTQRARKSDQFAGWLREQRRGAQVEWATG